MNGPKYGGVKRFIADVLESLNRRLPQGLNEMHMKPRQGVFVEYDL